MSKNKEKLSLKKAKNPEERDAILVQLACNSPYSIITPCNNGLNAYVKHPLSGKTPHFDVSSEAFETFIAELVALGMGERLTEEMTKLAAVSPIWNETAARVIVEVQEEEVAEEAA